MNRWFELTRTALLGTQRAPLPDLGDESRLGQLLGRMTVSQPEQALLQMVGTLDLYEQVGWQPQQFVSPTASYSHDSFGDDLRTCPPALAKRLAAMLDGSYRDLLHECLAAMAKANLPIPAALLPDYLERGQKTPLLRPFLLPVLGGNGRWLAAQNPAWAYASPASETWDGLIKQWRQGSKNDRHALLRQLRYTKPALGLALVAGTWKSETAPNRISFMRLLETGLSMADEPFLEAALDDREAQVRRKAAELLACLPQSRLCQRMVANSQQLLSYDSAGVYQIVPTFPIPINDEMVRDGIAKLAENLTGDTLARARSRQLTQIVGAIPLDYWIETWQAAPETIVRAAQKSRWPRTLTQALALAAERQRNAAWALALAKYSDFKINALKIVPVLTPEAVQLLSQQFHDELDETLPPLHKDSPLLRLLRYWPHVWDAEQTIMWTEFLVRQINVDEKPTPFLSTAVKQLARACPPESADGMITAVTPLINTHTGWKTTLNEMIRVLRFRRDMYEEIEIDD